MTNTVLIKRSSTANTAPSSGVLQYGELALNYTDGNLFYKNSGNVVTVIASNQFVSVAGNITGGNLLTSGLVSAAGNVTASAFVGQQANVDIIADTNTWTFDTTGALTAPGNITATGNIWGGGVRSTASATEPLNPGQGDIWYNTATDVVYRYTYDGTSYYWIDFYGSTLGQDANIYLSLIHI